MQQNLQVIKAKLSEEISELKSLERNDKISQQKKNVEKELALLIEGSNKFMKEFNGKLEYLEPKQE